jgi:uncharacterized protein (TIGR03032 family)
MAEQLQPLTCTHSANLPELLSSLNCSIIISTYQAGKVIFISAADRSRLVQLPRNIQKPMGIAIQSERLAIASRHDVTLYTNAGKMAGNYPKQPNTYDALYLPRSTYYTGETDIHDLHWQDGALWAVNTRFSCLSTFNIDHSFVPVWKPFFIDSLAPEDRCHLNGVAYQNGKPKYVTALGKTNTPYGWRENKVHGGILIDADKNEIICEKLPMPHSPRIYNEGFFVLLSATGEIAKISHNGSIKIMKSFDGFVRGMDRIGNFLFIGLSKLRTSSSTFHDLPIANKSVFCGIAIVDINTWNTIGYLKYENSVDEIYDVRILPGKRRPGLLTIERGGHFMAITTPEGDFWAQPDQKNMT